MPLKRKLRSTLKRLGFLPSSTPLPPPQPSELETYLVQGAYITIQELNRLKTGQHTTSVLSGKEIKITDSFWYLHSLKELFAEQVYRFRTSNACPYILDCGANMGLSAIYFKQLYPNARIVAFEPDTNICNMLRSNLLAFEISDVRIENKAVWTEDSLLSFTAAGSLGGHVTINREHEPQSDTVSVPAVALKHYLQENVDFLKMDIEGPEVDVLESCSTSLPNVQHLFVEYHSDPTREQQLDRLLTILRKAGFRVYIKEAWNNLPFPFLRSEYRPYYDLQLNVFAYRH